MAGNGDSTWRLQLPVSRNGGTRRRSELTILGGPLGRRKSGQSVAASSVQSDEKAPWPPVNSTSDRQSTLSHENSISQVAAANPGHHPLRTVPVWVLDRERANALNVSSPMPTMPDGVRVAQHLFVPHQRQESQGTTDREYRFPAEESRQSRWATFARSSIYPQTSSAEQKRVDHEWLVENFGDYSEPWQGKLEETDVESGLGSLTFHQRRKRGIQRFQRKILQSPMVPLIIRLTVFIFSLCALALGGSIRHLATKFDHPQGASADMAIVVDAVALVYLVYITYDEYTGKPLGLRPPKAKMKLIFLDLFFIVFASANLSLAFESLGDITSACTAGRVNEKLDPKNDTICERQKALASVLLIALIAWLMTFAISVLRVVERVTSFN